MDEWIELRWAYVGGSFTLLLNLFFGCCVPSITLRWAYSMWPAARRHTGAQSSVGLWGKPHAESNLFLAFYKMLVTFVGGSTYLQSLFFPVAGLLQVASTRKPHSETGWDAQRFSSVHESVICLQMIQPQYLNGRLNQTKSVVPKWYQTTCSHNQYKKCICSCQFRWWQLKHVFLFNPTPGEMIQPARCVGAQNLLRPPCGLGASWWVPVLSCQHAYRWCYHCWFLTG